ncbi:MAG: hydroxymethylglutaryl-CoA lyase [Aggregatilineales bacterium]
MGERVRIVEVGPRDGLQNEKVEITTAQKLRMIDLLVDAGLDTIELTSFVSPKAVPMMADAAGIMQTTRQKYPDVRSMGLIFNERGYDRAREAGCNRIALVLIVSDALSRSNSGKTADEWIENYKVIIQRAHVDGVWVRVYLASAWVCNMEGEIPPEKVFKYGDMVWELGVDELCPTDPIGHAHPLQVGHLMEQLGKRYDINKLAVHLHDTQALGLANAYAALQAGVRIIDSSTGGVGGCPFAPGAAGNLATEDLVLMLHKMGFETGVDLKKLWHVVEYMRPILSRSIGGRIEQWWNSQKIQEQ